MKRIIKITLISLSSFIAFVILIVALAAWLLVTPARVTPIAENIVGKFIRADVKVGSVDISFFSNFPQLGIELKNGVLISKVFRDSNFEKQDTLVAFERCLVEVDVWRYIRKKRIRIPEVVIETANVYLFLDSNGIANYDIALPSADSLIEDDTTSIFEALNIRSLHIENTNVIYDDLQSGLFGSMDSLTTNAKFRFSARGARVALDLNNKKTTFRQDNKTLVEDVSLGFKTNLTARFDSSIYRLDTASLRINKVRLRVNGNFSIDTATGNITMNAEARLRTPSLKDALEFIPPNIIPSNGVDADGRVSFRAHIYGTYGIDSIMRGGKRVAVDVYPEAEFTLKLKNGKAHYTGMPYGIDTLSIDFTGFADLNKKKESYLDLKILRLTSKAAETDVLAQCSIRNLLTKPNATFKISSNINLERISKVIPMPQGISASGLMKANLNGQLNLDDILASDFAKIKANGELDFRNVVFIDSLQKINAKANGNIRLRSGRFFGGSAGFKELSFRGLGIRLRADSVTVRAFTENTASENYSKEEGTVVRMGATIKWEKLFARMDTISIRNTKGSASVRIRPQKNNAQKQNITLKLNCDTLNARAGKIRAKLNKAEFDIKLQRVEHKPSSARGRSRRASTGDIAETSAKTSTSRSAYWQPEGIVAINRLTINMPNYALPITLRTLKANMQGDTLNLERASLRIGKSNLTVAGRVDRLMRTIESGRRVRAQVHLTSRRIDCNQLVNAMASSLDSAFTGDDDVIEATDTSDVSDLQEADSLQNGLKIFAIPRKLNLIITLDAKRVLYDKMIFQNIKGDIEIKNQTVNLKNLLLQTMDADMRVSMVYAAPTTQLANVGFDLGIKDMKIENLIQFIPMLDSSMPMLQSFQGEVDVDATASGALDSNMSIMLPSLTAALHLHGDNLVLLDGETFAQIAKMLLFKNKEHNMIDSLSTSITVQDGEIRVFPFTIEMDRYRIALGGTQDLDMNLNYHISVLKSPSTAGTAFFRYRIDSPHARSSTFFRRASATGRNSCAALRCTSSTSCELHTEGREVLAL